VSSAVTTPDSPAYTTIDTNAATLKLTIINELMGCHIRISLDFSVWCWGMVLGLGHDAALNCARSMADLKAGQLTS
jgi:hypothetical protein